jgi:AraC family transcriptional regulator
MRRVMRLENSQALEVQLLKKCDFSVARMTNLRPNHGMVGPLPREDAFLLSLQLRDFVAHDLWVAGRPVRTEPAPAGTFRLLRLREEAAAFLRDPFDSLHFYIYKSSLRAITEEEEAREVEDFGVPPGNAYDDPVVRNLGAAILPALAAPVAAPALFVEHVSIALHLHLAQKYGRIALRPRPARGKLAPWQERRAKELMIAGIRGEATLAELARECGLSRSHFARAFKATTGSSPHRWLQARRVERASELLEHSSMPVGEIARQLGFADQSHFTRVFRRSIGETPRAWRRQRRE